VRNCQPAARGPQPNRVHGADASTRVIRRVASSAIVCAPPRAT
jgi:hypothetical protein